MFEIIVLVIGAMPFLVGIYAIRMMKKSNDKGSDEPPPPPDPNPPLPILPPSPEPKRVQRRLYSRAGRGPVQHTRILVPHWSHRVRS